MMSSTAPAAGSAARGSRQRDHQRQHKNRQDREELFTHVLIPFLNIGFSSW
jgi:hypothetical protein